MLLPAGAGPHVPLALSPSEECAVMLTVSSLRFLAASSVYAPVLLPFSGSARLPAPPDVAVASSCGSPFELEPQAWPSSGAWCAACSPGAVPPLSRDCRVAVSRADGVPCISFPFVGCAFGVKSKLCVARDPEIFLIFKEGFALRYFSV